MIKQIDRCIDSLLLHGLLFLCLYHRLFLFLLLLAQFSSSLLSIFCYCHFRFPLAGILATSFFLLSSSGTALLFHLLLRLEQFFEDNLALRVQQGLLEFNCIFVSHYCSYFSSWALGFDDEIEWTALLLGNLNLLLSIRLPLLR